MARTWESLWKSVQRDYPSYLVILLGIGVQLVFVTRPFDFLLRDLLPDDAFYYFEIARQIVSGAGSTFDGINPTNGYHPLWMVILLPIYALFSVGGTMDTTPIYVALLLSVLISIATALVLLRLLKYVTPNPLIRACALVLWCLSPFVIYESMNGLETALSLFFASLFFLYAVRIGERNLVRDQIIAGVVAGLMVLSRMDLAFYAIAFALWLLMRFGIRAGMVKALRVGIIALVVASPWFIWNYLEFGMVLTSAANGNTIINHALVVADNGPGLVTEVKGAVYLLLYHASVLLERSGIGWVVFALCGIAVVHVLRRPVSRAPGRMPVLVALFLGCIALFFVNAGLRFTGRTWYFVSANIFLILLCAWTLEHIEVSTKRLRIAMGALTALVVVSFGLVWYTTYHGQNPQQVAMLEMAEYMNENLPAGTNVGVFNAGVQRYFSHVRVVNLDGLVNNAAYEAIRDYRLWSYIASGELEYVSDFDLYIDYRYKPFFDAPDVRRQLEEVHRIEVPFDERGNSSIALYRLISAPE